MQIRLAPRNSRYLEPRHIVARLAQFMPKIMVDWVLGHDIVEEKRKQLVAENTPEIIIASHQSLVDQTAFVQVWFPQFQDAFVYLVVQPHSALGLRCSDPSSHDLLAHAANQVAHALGYHVVQQS